MKMNILHVQNHATKMFILHYIGKNAQHSISFGPRLKGVDGGGGDAVAVKMIRGP